MRPKKTIKKIHPFFLQAQKKQQKNCHDFLLTDKMSIKKMLLKNTLHYSSQQKYNRVLNRQSPQQNNNIYLQQQRSAKIPDRKLQFKM